MYWYLSFGWCHCQNTNPWRGNFGRKGGQQIRWHRSPRTFTNATSHNMYTVMIKKVRAPRKWSSEAASKGYICWGKELPRDCPRETQPANIDARPPRISQQSVTVSVLHFSKAGSDVRQTNVKGVHLNEVTADIHSISSVRVSDTPTWRCIEDCGVSMVIDGIIGARAIMN